ncbi:MAG TPA: thermonuclease family protein [Hyphomicrobium sp.]|nr:thermonuclease family protein [Hyphomicrobium sp.]
MVRVIDGETLLLDDGREVRLIGALSRTPDATGGNAQTMRALEELVGGRSISFRYEGRRRDRYGRTLAQVYLAGPDGSVWLQQHLISQGHARAYALPGNSGCLRALMAAEAEARQARLGLWSSDHYRIRDAADPGALSRLSGQFALVEGRVANVTRTQRTIYINFGSDWRRDFTASVSTYIADSAADGAARIAGLSGQTIRVRGWIERRNGPMIVLGSLDEIEVLSAEDAANADAKTTGPR